MDLDAVDFHGAVGVIYIADYRLPLMAVKITMEPAVGGVPFNVMRYILKRYPGLTTNIDHNFIEILAGHMMPDGEFTDPAETVHPKLQS